jgi:hypothetical protein
MRSFLLSLPEKLQIVVVVITTIIVAFVSAIIVRQFFDVHQLESNLSLITSVYTVLGTLYAVLLAFSVTGVWQDFSKALMYVQKEADALTDLVHMVDAIDEKKQLNFRSLALAYAAVVVNVEWPTLADMSNNFLSVHEASHNASLILMQAILAIKPENERQQIIFAQALSLLNNWEDARRTRIMLARGDSAKALWPLLIAGGVILFAFHGLFITASTGIWAGLLLGLSFTIGLAFYLIFTLDCPFTGIPKVEPAPFTWVLDILRIEKPAS